MVKKQKKRSTSAELIKKSDEIIVVAKTPIEEIIIETASAKEIKQVIRKLKETVETKVEKVKEKISEKASVLYAQANRLISNVYSSPLKVKKLDYSKLYKNKTKATESSYEEIVRNLDELQTDDLGEKEIVQEDDLMNYLRKFMMNQFVGQDMNDISIEEKEKMNYYVLFNKEWVMMKIPLLGLGEKTYHAPRD